jgi:predicted  nucleic acid-binding Zn-ribbon protein
MTRVAKLLAVKELELEETSLQDRKEYLQKELVNLDQQLTLLNTKILSLKVFIPNE